MNHSTPSAHYGPAPGEYDQTRSVGKCFEGYSAAIDRLADRELEVFDLVSRGPTTREIAAQLGLGITTVDIYKTRIREKLNLENSAQLRFAASRWVQLSEQSTC
jgi:DNA-binding CsgD family transcriptional regulator